MRDTLTISLPAKLRRTIARSAKKKHMTASEFIRDSVQRRLWEDAFDETARAVAPRAREMGIYSDEDVFKNIS
ncbi:MAG: hypothetical protein HY043_01040 [Verrucomicrobia bacterium]|nr:hypothetical protein [Verrucomicrobiota bacterium]